MADKIKKYFIKGTASDAAMRDIINKICDEAEAQKAEKVKEAKKKKN